MSKKIKIMQIKSAIGYNKKTKATIEALGLKKIASPALPIPFAISPGQTSSIGGEYW